MNRKLLVGLVVGVLVIAAAGLGYAAWSVAQKGNEQDRKAEVVRTTRAVDDKLDEVWETLAERDAAWATQVSATQSDLASVIGSSESDVEKLREQVAEARELVNEIPSEPVKAAYLEVCDELDKSFDAQIEEAADAKPMCDAWAMFESAWVSNDAGSGLLHESIKSCNAEKYSEGKGHAENAQAQFQAARDLFAQAAALSGLSAVNEGVRFFDAEVQLAAMQVELASIGARGGVNSYNKQIDRLNEQEKVVDSLRALPNAAETALWSEAEGSYGHFKVRAGKAKNLWDDACELVSAGEV